MATHYHSFSRPGFFETAKITLAFDLADLELHGWIQLRASVSALVNVQTKQTLLYNPLFECTDSSPVEQAADESRPAGWGVSDTPAQAGRRVVRSGGIGYEVSEMISGQFSIGQQKQEVYAAGVQASLQDVLKKIENPKHLLAASLETGLASLEVAVRATDSARNL